MKILVLDDLKANRLLLKSLLTNNGYEVDTVSNGEEGISNLNSYKYDLIISDILMPVMDGFKFCKIIKSDEKHRHIPFLFYTATYTENKDKEFALGLGADDFLIKPVEADDLLKIVKNKIGTKSEIAKQNKKADSNEKDFLSLYNEKLVRKLERKMMQLERENKEKSNLISKLKLSEKNLKIAKEKAENSDRLKTEFLAQVSHEIRTPINTILTFSSLIKEELAETTSEKVFSEIDILKRAGNRIVRTVELLIGISELQSANYLTKLEKLNLYDDVIEDIFLEFKRFAKKKGLEFKMLNGARDIEIFADQYSFKQILNHIFENAIKYTKIGSIITKIEENDEEIILSVTDSGIGISDKYLNHIYEPFSQEDVGTTRQYEGSGLGMTLVKKYCDINNIKIDINSEKDKGTKVELRLKKPDQN